jgi:hypothetical protein
VGKLYFCVYNILGSIFDYNFPNFHYKLLIPTFNFYYKIGCANAVL